MHEWQSGFPPPVLSGSGNQGMISVSPRRDTPNRCSNIRTIFRAHQQDLWVVHFI